MVEIIRRLVRIKVNTGGVLDIVVNRLNGKDTCRNTGILRRIGRALNTGQRFAGINGQFGTGNRLNNLNGAAVSGKAIGRRHIVFNRGFKSLGKVTGRNNTGRDVHRNVFGISGIRRNGGRAVGKDEVISRTGSGVGNGNTGAVFRNFGKFELTGGIVNVLRRIAGCFTTAVKRNAGSAARNRSAHRPAIGTGFGIFQTHVAGIAEAVVNQSRNFAFAAGGRIGRIINRIVRRQVGTEAYLVSRGSRTADIGQIDRTQVSAVDDVVVDVNGVAGGIVIGFHIFDAVDVDNSRIRIAVPGQQRPGLRIVAAGVFQIAVFIDRETAGAGIGPEIAFARIGRLINDKIAGTADGYVSRVGCRRQQSLSADTLLGLGLNAARRI